MKKWIVRGKLNKEKLKEKLYLFPYDSKFCRLLDIPNNGYIYIANIKLFDIKTWAMLYKDIYCAEAEMNRIKNLQKHGDFEFVKNLEVIEVEIIIPGDE